MRSISAACVPITSGDASVEPPSMTMYSLLEKPCAVTLRIVSSNPAALSKLIVTMVKSGSDRAIKGSARALPSDNHKRCGCHRHLTCDLGCVLQELPKIEWSEITRNHDCGTRRNDIRIVECQPIIGNWPRRSVGQDNEHPPLIRALRRATRDGDIITNVQSCLILE